MQQRKERKIIKGFICLDASIQRYTNEATTVAMTCEYTIRRMIAFSVFLQNALGTFEKQLASGEIGEASISGLSWNTYEELVSETFLVRLSEAYMVYLKDLARRIFATKPETMKSSKELSHEFILEHSNFNELISAMADNLIKNFNTFKVIKTCYEENFGILLHDPQTDLEIDEIVAIRNVLVHNKGIIDDKFKKRIPNYEHIECLVKKNEEIKVKLNLKHVNEYLSILAKSIADIDNRAASKFNLCQEDIFDFFQQQE